MDENAKKVIHNLHTGDPVISAVLHCQGANKILFQDIDRIAELGKNGVPTILSDEDAALLQYVCNWAMLSAWIHNQQHLAQQDSEELDD